MVFKSFVHFSRNAHLAKNLWTTSQGNPSSQPGFFVSTRELPRLNAQVAVRPQTGFGNDAGSQNEYAPHNNTRVTSGLGNSVVFSTHVQLSSLDEEKEAELDGRLGLISANGASRSKVAGVGKPRNRAGSILLTVGAPTSRVNKRSFSTSELNRQDLSDGLDKDVLRIKNTGSGVKADVETEGPGADVEAQCTVGAQYDVDVNVEAEASADVKGVGIADVDEASVDVDVDVDVDVEPTNFTDASVRTESDYSPVEPNTPTSQIVDPVIFASEVQDKATPSDTSAAVSDSHELYLHESAIVDEDEPIEINPVDHVAEQKIAQRVAAEQQAADQQAAEHLAAKKTAQVNQHLRQISLKLKPTAKSLSYDLSPLLEEYFSLLKQHTVPNTETYNILIGDLVDASQFYNDIQNDSLVYSTKFIKARHGHRLLPSVTEQLAKFEDGKRYLVLALDLFAASNSVKLQKYPASLYHNIIRACILYGEVKRLTIVIDAVRRIGGLEQLFADLIEGYGMQGDMKSALAMYDMYKEMVLNDDVEKYRANTLKVYSNLISAYFYSGEPALAVQFLDQILRAKEPFANQRIISDESFATVLSAVVDGFVRNGELDDAWTWVKNIEQDKSICSISIKTISNLFSNACTKNSSAVEEMFDFIASQNRSVKEYAFNNIRCDYLMHSIKNDNEQGVYKAIKESHLRGGIWDETTIVNTVEYLTSKGDVPRAVDVYQSQSTRLSAHLEQNHLSHSCQDQMSEAATAVSNILSSNKQLSMIPALVIANSTFAGPRIFASGGGNEILKTFFNAHGTKEYDEILKSSKMVAVDVAGTLSAWIESSECSLGGLSIPSNVLGKLKVSYSLFVRDIMMQNANIDRITEEKISKSLGLLEDNGMKTIWADYLKSLHEVDQTEQTPLAVFVPLAFNIPASRQIIGYAATPQGLNTAYEIYQNTLTAGDLVTPEAVTALIDNADHQKVRSVLGLTYARALEHYPHPAYSPQAWDVWVSIHRHVVEHGAELDYGLARQAHFNLLDMQSSPDATGYGKLISHEPVTATRDEATNALRLFNESRSLNIVPNTFLFNVLLSKLSKARRLNEALKLFSEMDTLGIKKSSITYGTMISACCRAGDEENAKKFFDEMEQSPFYVPKVAPFNIMLQFYAHTKKDRVASLKIYNRLRTLGITPSAHTYKVLIDLYSCIEPIDLDAADNVLLTIQKDQQPITSQHFASLLYARGVLMKDLPAAQKFYQGLVANKRVKPDKVILQAMLESYVVNNQVTETSKVLDEMMRYNVDLNAYMANILIRGWAPVDMAKSVGLFDYILNSNMAEPSSYESMVRVFIFYRDFESAGSVLTLMRANEYPEPVVQKVEGLIAHYSTPGVEFSEEEVLLENIFRPDVHQVQHVKDQKPIVPNMELTNGTQSARI